MDVLSLLFTILAAHAHVGAPVDAVDVHAVDHDGRALEASIGLFWTEDGEDWRWVCHEAVTTDTAIITPRYAIAGRRWLVSVSRLEETRTLQDAVYWTDDGCTWTVSDGLTGREVPEVAIDDVGTIALAVTDDEGTAANHIFRSTDGGQTFAAVLEVPDQQLTSVVLGPNALGTAMVGGLDTDGNGWLHWSTDHGETWDSHLVAVGEVVAMAVHPTNANVGFAVIDGVGVETLLRTEDAGASVEVVLDPDGAITDVEVEASGGTWVSFSGSAYLYAEDGVEFGLVTNAPPGIGLGLQADNTMLATRFELVNDALAEGTRADGFTPRFSFVAVDGPLECAEGTHGADICGPLYPLLEQSLGLVEPVDTGGSEGSGDGGDGDVPSPDTASIDSDATDKSDSTCGCNKGAWVLLLPLGAFARRPRHD